MAVEAMLGYGVPTAGDGGSGGSMTDGAGATEASSAEPRASTSAERAMAL